MSKHFTTFNFQNMKDVDNFINANYTNEFNLTEIKDLLYTENVNFVLSGINRLQSTILCEEGYSYVQQSQRYVPMNSTCISILENTPDEVKTEGKKLTNKALKLYHEMTELNDKNKTGRLTNKDFKHDISYEDARYILPLSISTNIAVAMPANNLIDLLSVFNKYPLVFNDLRNELLALLPQHLSHAISIVSYNNIEKDRHCSDKYFQYKMKELCLDNNVIMLDNNPDNIKYIAIGALASQNAESPDKKYYSWKESTEINSNKLIKNVNGYGHTGINEHGRNTFAMMCSLSAYHQVIRHRLQNIRRESFTDILNDNDREFMLPKSIKSNKYFYEKVNKLINEFQEFYNKFNHKVANEFLMQFFLNCTTVKFVVSSNIRNDNLIFRDRLCFTAQEEIRNLYFNKFKILYNLYPQLVVAGLPPCVLNDKCKEGKLCCGKITHVKNKYKEFI